MPGYIPPRRLEPTTLPESPVMTLTALDPGSALILVDLQKGIVDLPGGLEGIDRVVTRARKLADAFRARDLPVVLVNVAGSAPGRTEQPRPAFPRLDGWTDFVPELDRQPGDILVTKRTWGAFTGTGLETQLKARGVTQVVIAGVATGTGVESTARQAYELGFNVTLATDAMADRRAEAHAYSLTQVFPRLGETATSAEIIDLLSAGGV